MEPDDRPRKTLDYMKPSEKTLKPTDDTNRYHQHQLPTKMLRHH